MKLVILSVIILASLNSSESLSVFYNASEYLLGSGLRERRQASSSLSVCVGGFSASSSGMTVCTKDASGQQRNSNELDCKFPFQYNGVWYDTCITNDRSSYWCSVDRVYTNNWATCQQSCPLLIRNLMSSAPGSTHSLCQTPNANAVAKFPGQNEINAILNEHNSIKGKVNPTASDMLVYTYDLGLARVAQKWAEQCNFAHDCEQCRLLPNNQEFTVGQNAFAQSGGSYDSTFWTNAINGWGVEVSKFSYGVGSTTGNWENVGHYTQIVTSTSTKVGCGLAQCGNTYYAFCNYVTAQMDTKTPYTSGTSCSKCSPQNCVNNVCNCTKLCQNYGTLDPVSCTCKCQPYAYGDQCENLSCDKDDKTYGCWDPNNKQYCSYANTKPLCPHLCGPCSL